MRTKVVWSGLTVLAGCFQVTLLALVSLGNFRQRLVDAVGFYLLLSVFYIVCVFLACQAKRGEENWKRRGAAIAAVAIVFRLTVWPLPPGFSDDVLRYRWEGKLQAAGGNPYQTTPDDPRWRSLRDETYARVPVLDARAGYGPLIELAEAVTYRIVAGRVADPWRQAFFFKAPAALFDLATIGLLLVWVRRKGLPPERLLIYAWCPLTVLEFWATGHNDPLMLAFLVAALLAAANATWLAAFLALGTAAAAKLWPFLLVPVFAGWRGWRPERWWQWTVAVLPPVLLFLPYWSDVMRNARYMSGFVGGWRNNDSLYGLLLWMTGDQYRAKYLAFGMLAAWTAWVTIRGWPLEKASLAVTAGLLLVSANCHPWYLTWLLPFLVVIPSPSMLAWAALTPIAYSVLIRYELLGEWNGVTSFRWLIYGPVFGLLIWEAWRARGGRGEAPLTIAVEPNG